MNPQAEIRLEEGRLIRTRVTNDPGFRLQWRVVRPPAQAGQEPTTVAEVNARGGMEFVPEISEAGTYQVFLELYFPAYRPTSSERKGEFRTISNVVEYVVTADAAPPEPPQESEEPSAPAPSP